MTGLGPAPAARVGVGVVLPADWWTLPLVDEDATRRAVVGLVDRQVGRSDAAAALRRELRVGVTASARRAAATGGWLMAFMLTRVGELPLPATLTAYRIPGSLAADDDVDALRASLTAHVVESGGRLDAGDGPFGLVLRTVRERTTVAAPGAPETPVLVCDYWADPGDGHGLVELSFSTPLIALRERFVELFDAVAGTLHRSDEPPEESPCEESPWGESPCGEGSSEKSPSEENPPEEPTGREPAGAPPARTTPTQDGAP